MLILKRIGVVLLASGLLYMITEMFFTAYCGFTEGWSSPARNMIDGFSYTYAYVIALFGILIWGIGLFNQKYDPDSEFKEVFW